MKLVSLALLSFLLLFASCGESPKTAPSQSEATTANSGTRQADSSERVIQLTPEALAQAHIVWEEVSPHSIPQTLRAPGRITVNENRVWRVGTIAEGRVVEMNANVDDPVRQGQVLARLQSHAVHDGRADYAEAKINLATLQTRRTFLLAQAARAKRLFDLKAASEQQVQQADSELRDVEGMIANAKSELERYRIHLEDFLHVPTQPPIGPGDRIAGHEIADLLPITAPAAGTVIARPVAPGAVVQAGQGIFEISDLSSVWMIAEVQQQHLAALREGMPVTIRTQAFPSTTFSGRIRRIGSELNAATRTISVRIEVPNRGLRLRPEMYADAEIAVGGSEDGLFLKQGAIQDLHGQSIVFVKSGDHAFTLRAVETGATVDGMRRVISGVNAGDQVVVDGSFLLKSKLLEASLVEE